LVSQAEKEEMVARLVQVLKMVTEETKEGVVYRLRRYYTFQKRKKVFVSIEGLSGATFFENFFIVWGTWGFYRIHIL